MNDGYAYEPTRLEVLLTHLLGGTLLLPYYCAFAKNLKLIKKERVLDYCCGCGHISWLIAKQVEKGNLTYSDVSEYWLTVAANKLRRYDSIGIRLAGFDGLINGGEYDRIIVHQVLHDFPMRYRACILRQLVTNLKPGGTLHLREPLGMKHGMHLHEIVNALEDVGPVELQYERKHSRMIGEYVDVACTKQQSELQNHEKRRDRGGIPECRAVFDR